MAPEEDISNATPGKCCVVINHRTNATDRIKMKCRFICIFYVFRWVRSTWGQLSTESSTFCWWWCPWFPVTCCVGCPTASWLWWPPSAVRDWSLPWRVLCPPSWLSLAPLSTPSSMCSSTTRWDDTLQSKRLSVLGLISACFVPCCSFIDALWPLWSAAQSLSLCRERSSPHRGHSCQVSSTDRPPSALHRLRSPETLRSAADSLTTTPSMCTTQHEKPVLHLNDWL